MRAWAVFKKEIRLYFVSPIAYVVLAAFAVIVGLFFYVVFRDYAEFSQRAAMSPQFAREMSVMEGVFRGLFENMRVILLFMLPFLTMRLFAEEKKNGTLELLLTFPIRDGEVLLGKYLAALVILAGMLAPTVVYAGLVSWTTPLEWGPLATGYLGLFLVGAAFISVGIFFSSITENQIVAAAGTFATLLIFWIVSWLANAAGPDFARVLSHVSLSERFAGFAQGVIDTKDVIFHLNLAILGLFLTLRALEGKRWRG